MSLLTFINADFKAINPMQDDPMVLIVEIENFAIMKEKSSIDILY